MATRIIYTVLDWGLGHATRSIPVIRELMLQGAEIILAGEGASLKILTDTFPHCTAVTLNGLQISYPEQGPDAWWAMSQLPSFRDAIRSEHAQMQKLVKQFNPQAIISDHRYGAYSVGIPSVFLAHQLRLLAGNVTGDAVLFTVHRHLLKPFNYFWVPDYAGDNNLSGELSHHPEVMKRFQPEFIGPQSRLSGVETAAIHERYDVLCICSGPEPSRTRFEKLMISETLKYGKRTLLLQGLPEKNEKSQHQNVTIISHADAETLKHYISDTPAVICRSGYSTLMDLAVIAKTACCIATPGQTEQEYLTEYLSAKSYIVSMSEKEFNLAEAEIRIKNCAFPQTNENRLREHIERFLKIINQSEC